MANNKVYIPTFISSINYDPTKVLPHIYFYNGIKQTDNFFIQSYTSGSSGSVTTHQVGFFPYVDNYSGNIPDTGSYSLLFNNETAPYGETPTESLYSTYWSQYVDLLYNPKTRVIDCNAIIPLADYFQLNLNDIVEWRGNYYHLRAINDYNLKNGECSLQLLGPVIGDVIANILPGFACNFNFSIGNNTPPDSSSFAVKQCFGTGSKYLSFTSSLSMSVGQSFTLSSSYSMPDCWYVSSSYSGAVDYSNVSISQSFVDCTTCSASLHPGPTPPVDTYNYYSIDKIECHQPSPCTTYQTGLVGRITGSTTLTNGYYYNNGDSPYVYLVNFGIASASADVTFDSPASAGTNCILTCQI
jgi:hypothetical protein